MTRNYIKNEKWEAKISSVGFTRRTQKTYVPGRIITWLLGYLRYEWKKWKQETIKVFSTVSVKEKLTWHTIHSLIVSKINLYYYKKKCASKQNTFNKQLTFLLWTRHRGLGEECMTFFRKDAKSNPAANSKKCPPLH